MKLRRSFAVGTVNSMRTGPRPSRKTEKIERLRLVLENVAGTVTPWETIARQLRTGLTLEVLEELAYRVERAIVHAFRDGDRLGMSR